MNDPKKYEFPKSIDVIISNFRLSQGKGQIYIKPERGNFNSNSIDFGIKKSYFLSGTIDDKTEKTLNFRKGSLEPKNIFKIQKTLNDYHGRIAIDFTPVDTNIIDIVKETVPEYFTDNNSNLNFLSLPNEKNNEVGFCVFGINMLKDVVNAMKFEGSIKIQPKKVNLKVTNKFGNTNGIKYYYALTQVSDGTNSFDVEVLCAYVFFNGTSNTGDDGDEGKDLTTPSVKEEDTKIFDLSKNFKFNQNDIPASVLSSNAELKTIIDRVKRELELGHYAEIIVVGFGSASKVPTSQFKTNELLAKTRAVNAKNAMVGYIGDELAEYMETGQLIVSSGIKRFKNREWVSGLDYYSANQWTNPEKYGELEAKINDFKAKHPDFRVFRNGRYSALTKKAKNEYKKVQKVKAVVVYKISDKKA